MHNSTNTSSFHLTILECYEPNSGEFKILEKILDDRPKQAYCESTLGTLAVEALGWDDDAWEESFEFSLRSATVSKADARAAARRRELRRRFNDDLGTLDDAALAGIAGLAAASPRLPSLLASSSNVLAA